MPTTAALILPLSATIAQKPRVMATEPTIANVEPPLGVERSESDDVPTADDRREDHCVDRAAPLLRPVDVLEVEPERELVERQSHADSEQPGGDLEPGAVGLDRECDEAGDHHEDDSEDEVVDVEAARA